MKKRLAIVNAIALAVTIFINYLSNTGVLNGNTMSTISDRYENYFTPAGYAFSIWGLIYLTLAGFVIYGIRNAFNDKFKADDTLINVGWWFLISCIANSLWVVTWLYDYLAISVVLMIIILICLLKIIVNTKSKLNILAVPNYLFNYLPFSLYAGWISVALIANMAAFLTSLGWNGFGINPINWTIVMIVVAGIVNVFMVLSRNLRAYGLVGIWALFAIANANQGNSEAIKIIYICYVIVLAISIAVIISLFNQRKIFTK
ncbi:MAG: tryptophan-rich sensory protein [Pedobacter sp.]|nr:MAG: tryptophan-rich sensory protein [Pedobacter sp.]